MTKRLDTLIVALRDRPADHRLDQLEPAVWARIVARSPAPAQETWGWRMALGALMLSAGVLAGGGAIARPTENSPFAIESALAPSTLLEIGQ